jgi:hypothetical protein
MSTGGPSQVVKSNSKRTRRAVFLEEMEQVVPWAELRTLIEPYYPKAGNWRPPVGTLPPSTGAIKIGQLFT